MLERRICRRAGQDPPAESLEARTLLMGKGSLYALYGAHNSDHDLRCVSLARSSLQKGGFKKCEKLSALTLCQAERLSD